MKCFSAAAAAAALTLGLSACAQNPFGGGAADSPPAGETSEGMVMAFTQFPDLPVPSDADMDVENTLVFGGGPEWFGQIALSAPHRTHKMYDFYKRRLPGYDWAEITAVRAPTSVMTHGREGRVLSIQISEKTLGGSYVILTVSPREDAPMPGAPGFAPAAAPAADAFAAPDALPAAPANAPAPDTAQNN